MVPGGAEGGHCLRLPQGAPGQEGRSAVTCLSSQERAKKQKKAAPSEEDDSGVEVYYREGEEEIETRVLPTVRDSNRTGAESCPGEGSP